MLGRKQVQRQGLHDNSGRLMMSLGGLDNDNWLMAAAVASVAALNSPCLVEFLSDPYAPSWTNCRLHHWACSVTQYSWRIKNGV